MADQPESACPVSPLTKSLADGCFTLDMLRDFLFEIQDAINNPDRIRRLVGEAMEVIDEGYDTLNLEPQDGGTH